MPLFISQTTRAIAIFISHSRFVNGSREAIQFTSCVFQFTTDPGRIRPADNGKD